ncbi:AraC family transcriptional regulator [Tenacibaculum sp. IB213877]|uniref:helix-turn-helix transcriptional regulator n=1 Tax=Tenacibaculum sp. IB213877 TaxID=3097351 RepID=UPI002A5A32C6|nr:AraC family transcriptional regulator [Tenacibaculum sp. IB213877]MDY0779767.1 AraC family transcriptional regulator [Tenacibaculum sp. IB213877]
MVNDYQKIDLFGKQFLQRLVITPPFQYEFPVEERACMLFVREGELQYQQRDFQYDIPAEYSLFLNCLNSGKEIHHTQSEGVCEVVILTFHPDILRKIYDKELPTLLQRGKAVTNQSSGKINHDFLIKKYIDGLMFYFENPALISEEMMILKLKEIIILLSQTHDSELIKTIFSQLFSPISYSFKQVIEAHLYSQISIEELAQLTNFSVSSFKREFSKLYHDTPAHYLKTKKLEKAAELLFVSDSRISDIAHDCGFNDLVNFTKNFTEKYKISPSQYRLSQIDK